MSITSINAGNFFRTVDTTKYGGQKRGPNGIGGGDNFVDQTELKALSTDKAASGEDKKAATWLLNNDGKNFKKYDENGDGKLSLEEATKAISDYNKYKVSSSRQNPPAKPPEQNNSQAVPTEQQPGTRGGTKAFAV
jgi:hypothetical protein